MIIYLDNDFKCHTVDDGTRTSYETSMFVGKSQSYIEGYRLVPEGETWVRHDGEVFRGLMVSPWQDYSILAAAQAGYEESIAEATKAYEEGVNAAYEQ